MSGYAARPLVLTRERLDDILARLAEVKLAFDDYSRNATAIAAFLTNSGSLVFEILDAERQPVGLVALHDVIPKHIGWFWLAAWDKRLADKVPFLRQLLETWAASLGLVKISANVVGTNYGYIKLLDKLGFRREGVHRKETRFAGQLVDVWYFGLLRDGAQASETPAFAPEVAESA